jgi:hypothetical protein
MLSEEGTGLGTHLPKLLAKGGRVVALRFQSCSEGVHTGLGLLKVLGGRSAVDLEGLAHREQSTTQFGCFCHCGVQLVVEGVGGRTELGRLLVQVLQLCNLSLEVRAATFSGSCKGVGSGDLKFRSLATHL